MKTCGHDGPLYRVSPKGTPGTFWCTECIRDAALDVGYRTQDLQQLCELIQLWTDEQRDGEGAL